MGNLEVQSVRSEVQFKLKTNNFFGKTSQKEVEMIMIIDNVTGTVEPSFCCWGNAISILMPYAGWGRCSEPSNLAIYTKITLSEF